jgi:hypothetical protein
MEAGSDGQKLSPASNAVSNAESLDLAGDGRDINIGKVLLELSGNQVTGRKTPRRFIER